MLNKSRPQISTIVVNWNRAELLSRTISSYLQTINTDYELIIVDNNSQDNSREVITNICENNPQHHAILLDRNTGGEALNVGAEKAKGKYIHFSENDIEYLPGWYEELLLKFEKFPELGQLSPFSPFPQKEIGEIFCVKETRPLTKDGVRIYVSEENVGTTSIIRREIWEKGVRWKSYGDGDTWFPDDGSFSGDVRQKGYLVAYNDRYVVINWGHNIAEFRKDPDYYVNNYKSKLWFGVDGFKKRLEEHGYRLTESDHNQYNITEAPGHDGSLMENTIAESANTGCEGFVLYDDPNRFARPAGIEISDYQVVLHGYQEFTLTSHALCISEIDGALQRKYELLQPYFDPQVVKRRTVLDLGASAGFFCFWAVRNGAESAVALDIDENYLALIEKASAKLNFPQVKAVRANIMEWDQPADITVALALIHWIYSCTADYGSLDAAVSKIAQLTGYMSIIEWVEPEDQAINYFHHLDWNAERVKSTYNLAEFKIALEKHFARYSYVGDVSPTRRLFVAYKTPNVINLSCPLPPLMPESALISSRILVTHNGIEYWSRVYDAGNCILKQAVLDLALREAYFLDQFNNEYFPCVYETSSEHTWSFIKLEKIEGVRLALAADDVTCTAAKFYTFIRHCLQILGCLAKQGITHRDIRMDNIIIRDNSPVLIDFGWAIAADNQYFEPFGLGDDGRPPDGIFDDVYSMGKVMEKVNGNRYAEFSKVIGLMIARDRTLRINDLWILQFLFSVASANQL